MEKKRKPRTLPKVSHIPRKKPRFGKHATSAITKSKYASQNLTLGDWLEVVAFCDENPSRTQEDIVNYFANRDSGALLFSQASLCRHLSKEGREADKAKAAQSLNALSSRRARIVTRPDVDRALVLWYNHMEEKGEFITGYMLEAKRKEFEIRLDVPVDERMKSTGWVPKFCKAYVTVNLFNT